LRGILEERPEWRVVAEAVNGREAVELAREFQPDVMILDISMPEMNGLEATREIVRQAPGCEVLILTLHSSEQLAEELLKAGARGYILKSDAAVELVAAVDALVRHAPYLTSKIAGMVLNGYLNHGASSRSSPGAILTPRERQVVRLLAEGRPTKDVAQALGISVRTAETHRTNIMHKLGLRSIVELVRYAMQHNLTVE